ncbi:alpha-E domain-containing protein [Piscinibacter koreensis]|uniref:Alpha-E domain-containing protein n=1 Tax=Piscinibacter koreensis TaxID=2742824 RepID=A0A7Y6NKZ3_9BURK|nr:alpha-E domain-containing protein [Schlegelella koreensis]NUZ05017.1 alpha-E domain-containing protein [Schlegelella koreensis]
MLSRTADHLFWMARYMERAENTARMLDVNYQMSLMPQSDEAAEHGWRGLLGISELSGDFAERYGPVTAQNVIAYMVSDAANGSSIRNCLKAARENARAVRGTLTTEVWETQNQTWLEFQRMVASGEFEKNPGAAFEWVKFRSHLSRGVTVGTMLQDEAFRFLRIGSFLERADNTARILDVKFHALDTEFFGLVNGVPRRRRSSSSSQAQSQTQTQTQGSPAEGSIEHAQSAAQGGRDIEYDFYHWSAILRSVSAFEIYRRVYRNVIRPDKVAELLILRTDMPRSLARCMYEVVSNLERVANAQSGDTQRIAGRMYAELQYGRIDEILATGLHAYLTQFLERVSSLGVGISRDFLVPVEA